MTLQHFVRLILGMLILQVGIFLVLVRRWWPHVQTFISTLHPFQKMALAVCAFGLATAYLLAFTAGVTFGAGHPQGKLRPEDAREVRGLARDVRGLVIDVRRLRGWVACQERAEDDPKYRYRFYWLTQQCIKYPGSKTP
ncbi:MAG TPA: hypothetical protein VGX68_23650 [Thermoanaerobaculia bacterium]|jgi:hypothetical protein|nr:hypothetical protein [Thermoanaerobaculia bacterium]